MYLLPMLFVDYPPIQIENIYDVEKQVSVSGISSGAYMAGQFHLSHSSYVNNATLFAGGPYFCSEGSAIKAMGICMKSEDGEIDLSKTLQTIRELDSHNKIDPTQNLHDDHVLIINGKRDQTVKKRVSESSFNLYKSLNVKKVRFEASLDIAHTFPTIKNGNECHKNSHPPFISACNIDGAKIVFRQFKKELRPKAQYNPARLFSINQWKHHPLAMFSMGKNAAIYFPKSCESEKCSLHVSFHGCKQTVFDLQDQYIKETGYLEWAESNNTIILFPQALPNYFGMLNPNGCWDWWGYTGQNFHNKLGVQIITVNQMIKRLIRND